MDSYKGVADTRAVFFWEVNGMEVWWNKQDNVCRKFTRTYTHGATNMSNNEGNNNTSLVRNGDDV